MKLLQIVGGKSHGQYVNGGVSSNRTFEGISEESYWTNLDADLYHWTKKLRPIQVWVCRIDLIRWLFHRDFHSLKLIICTAAHLLLLAIGQWYPGHIAKTEKELKEQLKLMDVVIEVQDARIPLSTSHPQVRLCIFFAVGYGLYQGMFGYVSTT